MDKKSKTEGSYRPRTSSLSSFDNVDVLLYKETLRVEESMGNTRGMKKPHGVVTPVEKAGRSSPLLFIEASDQRKKEKPLELPFYAGSDKILFHIGGYKYIIVSQGGGASPNAKIRIAELTTDPSRKTFLVRLTLQQWMDLGSWASVINDVIEKEKVCEGTGILEENGRKRLHLGGNVYVTLKKGLGGVDVRWFWLPPSPATDYQQDPSSFNVQSTRYGIWLSYKEWAKLDGLRSIMHKCIPALEGMDDCASTHFNQEELYMCIHCNPNGHHVWV